MCRTQKPQRDEGVTLIELMISVLVMSIAMAMAGTILIVAQRATSRMETSQSTIDDARLLSATLDRELRSAICITAPGENQTGNTLTFQTIAADAVATLTYTITNGAVTRTDGLGQPLTVIDGVGATSTAFRQVTTPLRTVIVNIPIRSVTGGEFQLQTTVAGRNAWRAC
jgi:prepilin-type N-terminal cleavage/methylation domain-containing protein